MRLALVEVVRESGVDGPSRRDLACRAACEGRPQVLFMVK